MYQVYVIKSETTGRIYIGQTENLDKRLRQHNDRNFNKRAFTKLSGEKWVLIYKEEYVTREGAIKREKQLKSSRGRDFIKTEVMGR